MAIWEAEREHGGARRLRGQQEGQKIRKRGQREPSGGRRAGGRAHGDAARLHLKLGGSVPGRKTGEECQLGNEDLERP